MARVTFPEHFLRYTGGQREVELVAGDFRDLISALVQRWPALSEALEKSAAAIDGQICQDAFLEPLNPDSEVFFMPRIEGG